MHKYIFLLIITCLNLNIVCSQNISRDDLTIIGLTYHSSAAGRLAIDIAQNLMRNLKLNLKRINTSANSDNNIPKELLNNIKNSKKAQHGKFVVHIYPFCMKGSYLLPKSDKYINIAYSIFDTTRIPAKWVNAFNKDCDMVVVPDPCLVSVYKKSGVKVPIFVLPHGLHLENFLQMPLKHSCSYPFVFGCASTFGYRKNHKLLIQAFQQEFGNSPNVRLKLHGFNMQDGSLKEIYDLVNSRKSTNIEIDVGILSDKKYLDFLYSLDCYVNLAKSEGFSVPPREVMALGIPCILSNNTAQKTLCNSGLVRPVKSEILEKAVYFPELFGTNIGYFFNCSVNDARKALRDVYSNYLKYLKLAHKSRNWVKKYDWKTLKRYYMGLFKPKKVVFGRRDVITPEFFMTQSKDLYEKLNRILKY